MQLGHPNTEHHLVNFNNQKMLAMDEINLTLKPS